MGDGLSITFPPEISLSSPPHWPQGTSRKSPRIVRCQAPPPLPGKIPKFSLMGLLPSLPPPAPMYLGDFPPQKFAAEPSPGPRVLNKISHNSNNYKQAFVGVHGAPAILWHACRGAHHLCLCVHVHVEFVQRSVRAESAFQIMYVLQDTLRTVCASL